MKFAVAGSLLRIDHRSDGLLMLVVLVLRDDNDILIEVGNEFAVIIEVAVSRARSPKDTP